MAGFSQNKSFRRPEEEVVALKAQEERADIYTALPGKIVSFDPASQTATVKPLYKPRHNGQPVEMPELLEVPVVMQRGGGFVFTHPIKAGDGVLLQFQARDMSKWYSTGEASEAASARMHDLSDAVAIPGLEPAPRKLAAYNPTNFEIRSEDGQTKIEISPDGKFRFASSSGESLLTILEEFMTVMMDHTNTGMPHDQAGAVAGLIARLSQLKL
jgi:hypothetical protein